MLYEYAKINILNILYVYKTLLRIFLNSIKMKVCRKSWAIQHTVIVLFYRFVTLIFRVFQRIYCSLLCDFFHDTWHTSTLMRFCARFLSCQLSRRRYNQGTWITEMTGKCISKLLQSEVCLSVRETTLCQHPRMSQCS